MVNSEDNGSAPKVYSPFKREISSVVIKSKVPNLRISAYINLVLSSK